MWLDHLQIPLGFVREYVAQVQEGRDIARPTAQIEAERDRITGEYRALLRRQGKKKGKATRSAGSRPAASR